MNKTEYLLSKLAEECMEVAQRCTKAQTFGLDEKEPGQDLTNAERIVREYIDLEAVIELLEINNIIKLKASEGWQTALNQKRMKVLQYMLYSREQGCLQD